MTNISYRIAPGLDGIAVVRSRLAKYRADLYLPGTFIINKISDRTYELSLSIGEDRPYSYWLPGNGLTYSKNNFPKYLKLACDSVIDSNSLNGSSFKWDGSTNISAANTTLEQPNVVSLNLASFHPIGEATHYVQQIKNLYTIDGRNISPGNWVGFCSDIYSAPADNSPEFFNKQPGKLSVECLVVSKNSSVQQAIDQFKRTRSIRILESVFISKQDISPTLGYCYVLYDDPNSFDIQQILPAKDGTIIYSSASSQPKINLTFTKSLEAYSRDNLYKNVYISNSNNVFYQSSSSTYNADGSSFTITPNSSSIDYGIHFIRISGGLQSIDGEIIRPGQGFINSCFTIASGASISGRTAGYYGSFYDTTDQSVASTTTAYPIGINSTSEANGISIRNGNEILFANQGTYSIIFSLQFTNADVQAHDAAVWFRKNGSDISNSNSRVTVPSSHGGINGHYILTVNFVITLNAADYMQLYWQVDSKDVIVETIAEGTSPVSPATPSVILTATQV